MTEKPILLDFPEEIETERLLLRPPRPGDGKELNEAVRDSWAELQPWMPWAQGEPPSVEDSEENVRLAYAKFLKREDLRLQLFLKGTETMVGGSGLHRIDWKVPLFEIGYWVRTPYAGQGYITEAVRAIADFAFDGLGARRVEIRMDSRNRASERVAQRANFTHEATLRQQSRGVDGELRDTHIYVRLR